MEKTPLNLETATALLHSKVLNENLRRHCYSVSKVMGGFYDYYKEKVLDTGGLDKDQWEIVGLLHDSDYEITKDDHEAHVKTLLTWLEDYEVPEELRLALSSHNSQSAKLRNPQTRLEWTLECCDELTGFIVAIALILPSKKLADVKLSSVIKRFDQPAFARAVDRHQIIQCADADKLNIPVEEFTDVALKTMQKFSEDLGL